MKRSVTHEYFMYDGEMDPSYEWPLDGGVGERLIRVRT